MPEVGDINRRTGLMGKDTEEFPTITVRSVEVWNGSVWRPVPMGCTPEEFSKQMIDWWWETLGGRRSR